MWRVGWWASLWEHYLCICFESKHIDPKTLEWKYLVTFASVVVNVFSCAYWIAWDWLYTWFPHTSPEHDWNMLVKNLANLWSLSIDLLTLIYNIASSLRIMVGENFRIMSFLILWCIVFPFMYCLLEDKQDSSVGVWFASILRANYTPNHES